MSLIAGLHQPDGGPLTSAALETLNSGGRLLAKDQARTSFGGEVGFAGRQLHAEREAPHLLISRDQELWVMLDGRLHDRGELRGELEACAAAVEHDSDPGLIMAAYRAWGLRFVERLIGELALAVWDSRNRRLLLARDAFGLRPLFFMEHLGGLVFASQVDQLLTLRPGSDLDLDPRFLADFFIAGKSTPTATPFRFISSLPAGHLLICDPSGRRTLPAWQLEDGPKLVYSDHQDYVDHFLDVLQRAVRSTLPASGDIWCDLSGGLDSSSITRLTALELGDEARHRLTALSIVFEETTGSDESRWARAVAEDCALKHHLEVSGDRHRAFSDLAEGAAYWDVPSLEMLSYDLHRTLSHSLRDGDARVLLKGLGAEFVVFGEEIPPLHLADLLRRFELRRLRRELTTWQKATRTPFSSLLFRHAIRPLLVPSSITVRPHNGVPGWIDQGFAKRMGVEGRADRAWFDRRVRSVPDQWQYEQIRRLATSLHPGCFHKTCAVGMPFLYRPLVELSLRIPWDHKVRVGTNKILLREAMEGILPEVARTRRQLVNGTPAIYRAMREHWPALRARIEKGRLADLGLVDTGRLLAEANRARHGGSDFLAGVLRPIVLDAWLESRLGDRSPQSAAVAA